MYCLNLFTIMDLDKLWFALLLPLCFCLETEADDVTFSLLTVISCMAVISTAAGFIIVAAVLLGLTLRKTHFRCCIQSERHELDDKQESAYTSLQQPGGDFYQTASPMNHHHFNALGTKSVSKTRKACLATEEQTEDIYENM